MSAPSGYIKISDKLQLSAKSWDLVKNPNSTEKFMKDMRPLVTMLSYGKWLETYLDHKCKTHQAKARASWMSSPDFSYNLDRFDSFFGIDAQLNLHNRRSPNREPDRPHTGAKKTA